MTELIFRVSVEYADVLTLNQITTVPFATGNNLFDEYPGYAVAALAVKERFIFDHIERVARLTVYDEFALLF